MAKVLFEKQRPPAVANGPGRPEKFSAPYQHELMGHADQIRELGITAGSKNRPQTNSVTLDISENEIKHLVEKKLLACQSFYERQLRGNIETLERLELEIRDKSAAGFIQRLIPNCKAQMDQLLARYRGQLIDLRHEEHIHEAALSSFKQIHNRAEPPEFPISQKAHYITLATIALLEGVFNIAFYGEFKGVATAILIAIGASVVNVGVSAFLGIQWRFKNSIRPIEQKLGWLAFGSWVVYTFYLDKFLAVFRGALDKVPASVTNPISQASIDASKVVFSYPWTGFLDLDIVSWFLFLFGTIVGVTSFIKGYFADDPYPRYGVLVRKHSAARYAYQKKERKFRDSFDAIFKEAEAKLGDIANSKKKLSQDFNELAQTVYKVLYQFQIDTTGILNDLQYLVKVYRDANRSARSSRVPPYFNRPYRVDSPEMPLPSKWQRKSVERTRHMLMGLVRDVQESCAKVRRDVAQMNKANGKRIENFFKEIDKEARRKLVGEY